MSREFWFNLGVAIFAWIGFAYIWHVKQGVVTTDNWVVALIAAANSGVVLGELSVSIKRGPSA